MTVKMFDAAYPPGEASEVADYQVCAGYIGGDTPHVWTRAEWERFSHMHKLPIFTRSDPGSANAAGDAFAALRQLHAIGASAGIPFALDFETQVNAGYVDAFYDVVRSAGFRLWVYGSASTVFGNPACNGYWVADYAGRGPFMYEHDDVRATQYEEGIGWDSSLVKPWQETFRLWK